MEFGPRGGGFVDVVSPEVLVLGGPRGYVTLRDGDLIRNRDAAMVLTAGAWNEGIKNNEKTKKLFSKAAHEFRKDMQEIYSPTCL